MKENSVVKISVILTCHNRKEKTILALNSLLDNAIKKNNYEIKLFVCDDGSTDGTSQLVAERYPTSIICKGDGDLFWARGMACALEEADKYYADFYLMINDDVMFFDNAIDIMLESYYKQQKDKIAISGATKDPLTGEYTYGGCFDRKDRGTKVFPTEPCSSCELANWNCFLIPQKLYMEIGPIDNYYEHSYADFDYSKRINQKGYKIFVASQYIGECSRNAISGTWQDKTLSIRQRISRLHTRTGLPIKSQIHYYKKFYPQKWIYYVAKPYLIIFKDGLLHKLKR